MDITFTFKTTADCQDYLHVIYDNTEFTLMDFARKYKTEDFSLDEKLKESTILYRNKKMTYEELCSETCDFSEELKLVERYIEEIYPIEHLLLISNMDYYKAAKFLNKTEKCLQTARYYLMNSKTLIKTDFDANWSFGYGPQFLLRTIDFTTAVVWYNSCFDYILQIVYFSFGIYKKTVGYSDQTPHDELLKNCTYKFMRDTYRQYKKDPNYRAIWKIISKCYSALSEVNSWANYIKHKGGISFHGLNPPDPFTTMISDLQGNVLAESLDFESIKIDMDNSLSLLKDAHMALYNCINEVIYFIDFKGAVPIKHPEKEGLVIPSKTSYVKVILP
jgi:tetratricopeptide (TPR) repeat protein